MAEASSSRPPETILYYEGYNSLSDDERKISGTSSRRRNHYGSQRVARASRPTTGEGKGASKYGGDRVNYRQPAAFSHLDEQAISPPVGNPNDRHNYLRRSSLEANVKDSRPRSRGARATDQPRSSPKYRNRQQGQADLSELTAPAPVQQTLDEDNGTATGHQTFLEDAYQEKKDSNGSTPPFQPKKPQDYVSNRDEQSEVPKWLTELYTVSYLIFFSILGTLARLGVQWITFYPGTPVVTPVIWANFGGSLIMGFLAEDQGLFRDNSNSDIPEGERKRSQSKTSDDLAQLAKAEHTKRKENHPTVYWSCHRFLWQFYLLFIICTRCFPGVVE